eukprot:8793172-Lingulodinium_polyedra.AAC.1
MPRSVWEQLQREVVQPRRLHCPRCRACGGEHAESQRIVDPRVRVVPSHLPIERGRRDMWEVDGTEFEVRCEGQRAAQPALQGCGAAAMAQFAELALGEGEA